MKKILVVLGLMLPLSLSALNIRPEDLEDSEFDFLNIWYLIFIICGFIILCVIALCVDGYRKLQNTYNKRHPKPYNLDKGEYSFFCYADSKSFKELGEQPKSTYKSIGNATRDYIYYKDGKYYFDRGGKFLPVEENPYFGDASLGEWGTYKYRCKVLYENTKYCSQGWCYYYFNIPIKKD